jgi:hypothetical protein
MRKRSYRAVVSGVGNGNGKLIVMGSIINEPSHKGREVAVEIDPVSIPWFTEAVQEYARKVSQQNAREMAVQS